MVLFITIRSFVTGAIVTVYNHDIGPCNLFQICNLFHHNTNFLIIIFYKGEGRQSVTVFGLLQIPGFSSPKFVNLAFFVSEFLGSYCNSRKHYNLFILVYVS